MRRVKKEVKLEDIAVSEHLILRTKSSVLIAFMDPMSDILTQSIKCICVMFFFFNEAGEELLWFLTANVSNWTAFGLF